MLIGSFYIGKINLISGKKVGSNGFWDEEHSGTPRIKLNADEWNADDADGYDSI